MFNAPDKQYENHTQHTECLHRDTRYAAAAQRDLNGLAYGAGLTRLVWGAHIGVSSAAHTEYAHKAAHNSADDKGNTGGFLNEKAQYQRYYHNYYGNSGKLGFDEGVSAASDYRSELDHVFSAFVKPLDL